MASRGTAFLFNPPAIGDYRRCRGRGLTPRPVRMFHMSLTDRGFLRRWGEPKGFDDLLAELEELLMLASHLGVQPRPGSRLLRLRDTFNTFLAHQQSPWLHMHPGPLLEGLRDLQEIAFTCRLFKQHHRDTLQRYLRALLSGAVLPAREANAYSRNLQHELFVGALFVWSGFPVRFEEPDVLFEYQSRWFGIAAKRVMRAAGVRRRTHEGAKQLKKSGVLGVVALSLDRLLSTQDVLLLSTTPQGIWDFSERKLHELLARHTSDIRLIEREAHVFGLLATLTVPSLIKMPPGLATSSAIIMTPAASDPNDAGYILAKEITDRIRPPGISLGNSPLIEI
jgi:hypothetical protein